MSTNRKKLESLFEQRVVTGGERLSLGKSWPDRLCKLLASAWDADHLARPTATQLVAELVAIKAELPSKYQRQRPVVTAPTPGGGGSSSSSSIRRRHSAASSSSIDKDGRARQLNGAAHHRGTAAAATTQLPPAEPLPLPLPPTSSSSSSASEKPPKWPVAIAKRPSWLRKVAPSADDEVGAAGGTRRPGCIAGMRKWGRSTSGASAAGSNVEENDNEHQHDQENRPEKAREAEEASRATATGDDGGRRQSLDRSSQQGEPFIDDALAAEATAEADTPRAGQQRLSDGEGGQVNDQERRSGDVVSEDGATLAEEAQVGEKIRESESAAATNNQKLLRARRRVSRGSSSSRPPRGPPRGDSETSARVRRLPAQRQGRATRKDSVGTHEYACENKHSEQRGHETADRGVTMIGTDGEDRGGKAGGRGRERQAGAIGLLFPPGQTNLRHAAVIEEDADEEDDENASGSGGSRGAHRNSISLDMPWPVLMPTGHTAKDASQQPWHHGSEPEASDVESKGQTAPNMRTGGGASAKAVSIFGRMGAPSLERSAEAIEDRLALLRGMLSMPRDMSKTDMACDVFLTSVDLGI